MTAPLFAASALVVGAFAANWVNQRLYGRNVLDMTQAKLRHQIVSVMVALVVGGTSLSVAGQMWLKITG